MLTLRENFLETVKKDGHPDRLASCYSAFRGIPGDPVFQYVRGNRIRGTTSYDRWGTLILFPEDQPAATPHVTPENQVIQDIEEWKKRKFNEVKCRTDHFLMIIFLTSSAVSGNHVS